MKAIVWPLDDDSEGAQFEVVDIPAEYRRRAPRHRRHELLETIAHVDDALLEKYLADEEISTAEIQNAIRARHARRFEFVPVLCGSALQEQGRAADARRGRRLPAVAARHPADPGHRR